MSRTVDSAALGEHAPRNAMVDPAEIARFHDRCSELMRELLDELASAPECLPRSASIDVLPSIEADPCETRERWLEHPLGLLRYVLVEPLQTLAEECNCVVQVTPPSRGG